MSWHSAASVPAFHSHCADIIGPEAVAGPGYRVRMKAVAVHAK